MSEITFRHHPPSLSPQTVAALLRKHFPFQEVHKKSIKVLPSYDDQNFYFCGVLDLDPNQSSQPDHCDDPNQSSQPDHCNVQQFVFKVYSTTTSYGVLDGQNCIMKHLLSNGINCPCPILGRGGKEIEVLSASQLNGVGSAETVDCNFCACVLTFIPGEVMDRVSVTPQLLYDLGNYIGKVDAALQDMHHADIESREYVEWDLTHFLRLKSHLPLLKLPNEREMIGKVFEEFEEYVLPKIPSMAHGVIYGDANGMNIIVENRNGEPNLVGIIDFGDSVRTCYVFELAIMLAYAMLEKENPLQISCPVLCGYLDAFALSDEELDCLYYLILARLCQSVLNSAYHLEQDPHNAYLLTTPPHAWQLMEHLRSVPKAEVDRMWAKAREEWSASHT